MRRRLAVSWAMLASGVMGIAEALWDLVRHPRRVLLVVALLVALVGGSVASARPAVAQDIREPIAGVCVRPIIGEGGILNLPLVDIPGQRIPRESLELTVGGEYSECHVR